MFRFGKWTQRFEFDKVSLVHIAVAVAAAVLISSIIVLAAFPSNADIARLDKDIDQVNTTIKGFGTLATTGQLNNLNNKVDGHTNDINALGSRQNETEERLNALAADLEELSCSPPEARLIGIFGNYTLYVKPSTTGNYTAVVNMLYATPKTIGGINATQDEALVEFYTGWVTVLDRDYAPSLVYNRSDNHWLVTRVSFSIGVFVLEAHTEAAIDIPFAGLNSTYAPAYSYVEVYSVLENK